MAEFSESDSYGRCDPAVAALWLAHVKALVIDISSSRFKEVISAANIIKQVMEVAPEVLKSLAEGSADDPVIIDLCERFMFFKTHMRSHSMQYPSYHPRIVSECIDTAVKRILARYPERDVTVVPEFDLTGPDSHPVTINPAPNTEVKVIGRVSHVVLYHPVYDILKKRLLYEYEGVITALAERRDISCVLVIEANDSRDTGVESYRHDAIGAALALISRTRLSEVRTCTTDGHHWLFGKLSVRDGLPVYMEMKGVFVDTGRETAQMELSRVVALLACWIDGQAPFVGK